MKYFRIVFHLVDGREIVAHCRNASIDEAMGEGHEHLRKLGLLDLHDDALSFELTADEYVESVKKNWAEGPSIFNGVMNKLSRHIEARKRHQRN